MSTNLQKRRTRLVRIGEEHHRFLKILAAEQSTTISKLLDSILADYRKPPVRESSREEIICDKRELKRYLKRKGRI
jgi:arginine deiminase